MFSDIEGSVGLALVYKASRFGIWRFRLDFQLSLESSFACLPRLRSRFGFLP